MKILRIIFGDNNADHAIVFIHDFIETDEKRIKFAHPAFPRREFTGELYT